MVSDKPTAAAGRLGLTLPRGYDEAKRLNLVNLHPWHLLADKEFDYLMTGLARRYSARSVVPFARRADNDDVACFVAFDPDQAAGEVVVVHDFASAGSEIVVRLGGFWEWFRYAVNEMIEWQQAAA